MRSVVIGTAGHIDHGKTSIVKALTGIDTDRLSEEKQKGISIDIGFSHLKINDKEIGIIDIPGHEKFIRNMLAGASGIDICLLIIACDDGIMPQTAEHFEILKILGIKHGIIVLNKVDKVSDNTVIKREEEIKEFTKNSFLENAPIIKTSIYDKTSIDNLKNNIVNLVINIEQTIENHNVFRMPIDRFFKLEGLGSIITGTTMGMNVNIGDTLEILPNKVEVRIKNIQQHGINIQSLTCNNRCALNITYNSKKSIKRGDVIATPNTLTSTKIVDVELNSLPNTQIKHGQKVKVYHLTSVVNGRIKLLENNVVENMQSGYAQLILDQEIVALNGDMMILRNASPISTIAGAKIINVHSKSIKRNNKDYIEFLKVLNTESAVGKVLKTIEHYSNGFYSIEEFRPYLISYINYESIIKDNINTNLILVDKSLIHVNFYEQLKDRIKLYYDAEVQSYGVDINLIRGKFFQNTNITTSNLILDKMGYTIENNFVKSKVAIKLLTSEEELVKTQIIQIYNNNRYNLVSVEFVKNEVSNNLVFDKIFKQLVIEKQIVRIADDLFTTEQLIQELYQFIITLDKISLSDVKEYTSSNRKHTVMILEYFDKQKITNRIDNYRIVI